MQSITRFLLFLLFTFVAVAGGFFTFNNTQEIPLWLGIGFAPKPLAVWVLCAFAAGALLGLLLGLGLWRQFRYRRELARLQGRLRQAEQEIERLRHASDSPRPTDT